MKSLVRFIQREIEAFRRDRAYYNKTWVTLRDVSDHVETYPSIIRRWHRLQGTVRHSWYNVRNVHRIIYGRWHRSSHGWNDSDIWNFDYHISRVIYEGLEEFLEQSRPWGITPDGFDTFEEWEAVVREMQSGFKAHMQDLDYSLDLTPDQNREAEKEALKRLDRSLDLLKEYYRSLWV